MSDESLEKDYGISKDDLLDILEDDEEDNTDVLDYASQTPADS